MNLAPAQVPVAANTRCLVWFSRLPVSQWCDRTWRSLSAVIRPHNQILPRRPFRSDSDAPDRLDAVDVEAAGARRAGGDDGVIEDRLDDGLLPVDAQFVPLCTQSLAGPGEL